MPVNNTHAEYSANTAKWKRCRDAVEGQDAIHAGGETYLPALTGQETADFNKYRDRAAWYNATGRTLQALIGLIFRKDEEEELPSQVESWTDDITLSGQSLKEFAQECTEHVMTVGRHGILVDFPRTEEEGTTVAEAEARNLRPYLTSYAAESIINWKTDRVGSRTMTVRVVLEETFTQTSADDEFEDETKTRYRVLDLEPSKNDDDETVYGNYRVRIFEEQDGQAGFVPTDSFNPRNNGQLLTEIPFIFLGATCTKPMVEKPPLIDVVNINISHYQTTADYEHGCHFTGLPTFYVAGYKEDDTISIGSETMLQFEHPETKVGTLEFTGKGLSELSGNLERKEKLMAALGARMLMPEKSAAESGIAEQTRRSGENSSLAKIANTVSKGLKQALQLLANWAPGGGTVKYALNTDYLPAAMSAQDLKALTDSYAQGTLPIEALYFNLQRGEALPDDMTLDDFSQGIQDNFNSLPPVDDGDPGE